VLFTSLRRQFAKESANPPHAKVENPAMDTPTKIGRYEILGELGHGAMGTVYRAKDPAMDRVVALKTIISMALAGENGNDFRDRFFREARAAGSLTHPGIVPVFDVGEHDGSPFLVMEFISGKTLADAMRRGDRLSLDRVCELGQKIAEALGYAHQHGVVHRDIKPANILLTSKEAHGIERPKITDFGVAKLAAGHTTLTGQIVGTPAFMAPEQFTGATIDGRADIFSLGVVLYWMATGEQPFPGESITAVSYKVVHTEPVPPRKLNPSVPLKLETIILRCLAKNPDERYSSGEELARELGELRSAGMVTGVKTSFPGVSAEGSDPNATFIEKPAATKNGTAAAAQSGVAAAVSPKPRSNNFLVLSALAVAVIGAGGLLLFRRKDPQPSQVSASTAVTNEAPPSAPVAAPVETSTPQPPVQPVPPAAPKAAPKAPAAVAKPPASAPQKSPAAVLSAAKSETPKVDLPAPEPAPVDFNPKSLDPKTEAKLKIEADRMPVTLDFSVELNGKIYLLRSAQGNKAEFDDWYVPPGVQEFRVTAGTGAAKKISNTVSTEFKARKKHTLKIELRTQGSSDRSAVPQGLYADTQIVLTLK
jgi:eukaryotic-like serine/threonine-protein kinase